MVRTVDDNLFRTSENNSLKNKKLIYKLYKKKIILEKMNE
jgi:hypothetical protein